MEISSISEFRKNAKKYLDQIVDDEDILIIRRPKGRSVVMIALDRFADGMDATAYLMAGKADRERLLESVEQVRRGEVIHKTWGELKAMERGVRKST